MEARGGEDENGDRNGGVRCGRIQTKPADGRMACGRSLRTKPADGRGKGGKDRITGGSGKGERRRLNNCGENEE